MFHVKSPLPAYDPLNKLRFILVEYNFDLAYLRKGNKGTVKHIPSINRCHAIDFPQPCSFYKVRQRGGYARRNIVYNDLKFLEFLDLEVFMSSLVIRKRTPDLQLAIKSYQYRLNLTKQTLTFDGIKAEEPYSIVDEPTFGITYLKKNTEKRYYIQQSLYLAVSFPDAFVSCIVDVVPNAFVSTNQDLMLYRKIYSLRLALSLFTLLSYCLLMTCSFSNGIVITTQKAVMDPSSEISSCQVSFDS
ncbi:hypothetical protein Tco_0781591 [Tanacetum coccineum]